MALTATFVADFSSFQEAVQKAEVSLKTLGDGANKVGPQLNRMVDQFSGRKLIQDATVMAQAVEEIGGASKLTAAQLQQLGAQANAAIEKLHAIGGTVPEGLQKIATAAKDASAASSTWGDKLKTLNGLLGGLGLGLSVSAIVSFGKAILDDADALTKLAAKTGISVEGLQRLQIAGDDAGNSIEDMTGAVNSLQNRIAGGDKSAVAALEELGINLAQFTQLQPDQQFIALSNAIRRVEDPAARVRLAMDAMGKAGVNVLPTLTRGFDDVADGAVIMSEATVEALDSFGDAWASGWRTTKAITGEMTVAFGRLVASGFSPVEMGMRTAAAEADAWAKALTRLVAAIPKASPFAALTPPKDAQGLASFMVGEADLKAFDRDMDAAAKATDAAAAASKKAAADFEQLAKTVETLNRAAAKPLFDQPFFDVMKGELPGLAKLRADIAALPLVGLGTSLKGIGTTTNALASTSLPQLSLGLVGAAAAAGNLSRGTSTIGATIRDAFGGAAAILDHVGGKFTELASVAIKTGQGIASSLLTGNWIGALVAGVTGAVTMIGKLFKDTEKEINPIRQSFVDLHGGLEALNVAAAGAGVTLTALLDAKNPKAYEAAIADLNAALKFQDDAMKTLAETTARYGFTIEELGPALAAQELDKQSQQIFRDWEVLNAAGIDTVAITTRMAEAVNTYVHHALAMGQDVPEAMRPMLEQMAAMGQLTDASGNKIENLEDAGISFALTMSQGFQALITEVAKLTDAIARGLGLAVDTTAGKLKGLPRSIPVDVVYKDPGFAKTYDVEVRYNTGAAAALEGYASGTDGFRNFGAGTPVMLHGWEAVVPREPASTAGAALPALLGASSPAAAGGDVVQITINAQGAFFDTPGSLQAFASRVEEALSARHGLTHKRRAA